MALDTAYNRCRQRSGKNGIFRIILEGPSAQRIPLNIHSGSQPDGHTEFLHFFTDAVSDGAKEVSVPALRKKLGARPCRCVLIMQNAVRRGSHLCFHPGAGSAEHIPLIDLQHFGNTRCLVSSVRQFHNLRSKIQSGRAVRQYNIGNAEFFVQTAGSSPGCANRKDDTVLPMCASADNGPDKLILRHRGDNRVRLRLRRFA